jgi:hypothetical protein
MAQTGSDVIGDPEKAKDQKAKEKMLAERRNMGKKPGAKKK